MRLITVWPEAIHGHDPSELKYRFAWTYPIVISSHDPDILYVTGNHVFKSENEGESWEAISPDLSRRDPDKLKASGGPITLDTSGAEVYGTVFAFAESPHQAGVLWAGTDDGLVHISRDEGSTWQEITPPELPEWSLVSMIEISPHAQGTAYVAATRYKLDDFRPFLFKTADYGSTWTSISGDFPPNEITRVVREDPAQPGLLFVGTETGLYVSANDGATWSRFQSNLPVAPVYDLVIKESDLVIATHGRSFWILDDFTPLRRYAAGGDGREISLVQPRTTVRHWEGWSVGAFRGPGKNYMLGLGSTVTFSEEKDEHGEVTRRVWDGGENPPNGVIIYYSLPQELTAPVELTLLDAGGGEIRSYRQRTEDTPGDERTLQVHPGLNRFVWDMRYPNAEKVPGDLPTEKIDIGPRAAPGRYQVRLTAGDVQQVQEFELIVDPRVTVTQQDLDAQFALWAQLRDKIDELHRAINRLRDIRAQVLGWGDRAQDEEIGHATTAIVEKLNAIEGELIQTGAMTASDRLRLKAKLNVKLITLVSVVAAADAGPTQQTYDVFAHLSRQADEQLARLSGLIGDDIAAFSQLVAEKGIPAVRV